MPSGVFHMPVTTAVVPLHWYVALRPDTAGNRPVLTRELHTGEKPFVNAVLSWSPVSVMSAVALPNGSTANASPQVISPTASPPEDGGLISRSCRRPPELV